MATTEAIRRAGLRETAAAHAQEVGRAGNRLAQDAEVVAKLATELYAAAEKRDFARLVLLHAAVRRHHDQAGATLAQLGAELEALAAAELAGRAR
jgi:hypothetical protein